MSRGIVQSTHPRGLCDRADWTVMETKHRIGKLRNVHTVLLHRVFGSVNHGQSIYLSLTFTC